METRFSVTKKASLLGLGLFSLISSQAVAQEAAATAPAKELLLFNPAFITLLSIVILLFIVVMVLDAAVKSARYNHQAKTNNQGNVTTTLTLLFCLGSLGAFAQTTAAPVVKASTSYYGLSPLLFYSLLTIIAIEAFIAFRLYCYAVILLGGKNIFGMDAAGKESGKKVSFLEKLNASVAIEKEADIMLDHNYDGIKELDNNLPPWWKYGFYVTIVFSIVYMVHYHITGSGKLQKAEYEEQLAEAKIQLEEYQKKAANLIDESNVTLLSDKEGLAAGQKIFMENCKACHGAGGEGGVGPNFADDYWIHGGSIKDVFKTVKFGWPEKGMKSWQQDLSAKQMQEVSSYIKSLRGTNPPNQKEKQGELYVDGNAAQLDSTATVADTSATALTAK